MLSAPPFRNIMNPNEEPYSTKPTEPSADFFDPSVSPTGGRKVNNWRKPGFFAAGAVVIALVLAGAYFGFLQPQPVPQPNPTPFPTVIIPTATATPQPTAIRAQDIGLPQDSNELQKEIEKRSAGKTQLSLTLPEDFPKDFPVYPGAKLLSSIRSTQEGLSFLVAWVTDDELDPVQAFYEKQMQEKPWNVVTPFNPAMVPSLSRRTLTFVRVGAPDSTGTITLAQETTGRGKTSIRVSYTSR